jgi:hypothetical protein
MSEPSVYQSNPEPAPDSAFVDGQLALLVAGNRGRLLDARRTPISLVEVDPERGSFTVQVDEFEDKGARWELSLDEVRRFQFERKATPAGDQALAALERSRARFARELVVECDDAARRETHRRLAERREEARGWLRDRASGLSIDLDVQIERREGHPDLCVLLEEFIAERDLAPLEDAFTAAFVSNPRSGELVKGHAIVLAELGLCPYRGQAPRDPELFAAGWSRARRSDHLLWRMAFTQAVLGRYDADRRELYRAAASDGLLLDAQASPFVSATFSREIAEEHFAGGPTTRSAVLWRQRLPIDRALMTFLETRAMNRSFQEAEAVLIGDPGNAVF